MSLVSSLTRGKVAVRVFAAVSFNVFGKGVQREMRCGVTEVDEEGFAVLGETFDRFTCVLRESVGGVVAVREFGDRLVVVGKWAEAASEEAVRAYDEVMNDFDRLQPSQPETESTGIKPKKLPAVKKKYIGVCNNYIKNFFIFSHPFFE